MTRNDESPARVVWPPRAHSRSCRRAVSILASIAFLGAAATTLAAPPAARERLQASELSGAFVSAAKTLAPSVVQIDITTAQGERATGDHEAGWDMESPSERARASGVVISKDGAIVTNNHVVERALSLDVRLADGRFLPARLVGRDPATDLAVLRVPASDLEPAKFADAAKVRVGQWVVAVGSPFGLGHSVTAGIVSATGRGGLGASAVEDYLQTDASIHPGNSGGPLANLGGEVVGINTLVIGRAPGVGFAVPANIVQSTTQLLLKEGRVRRAWIGVGVQDLTPALAKAFGAVAGTGALVNRISPKSPAKAAHLVPGDVIERVRKARVTSAHAFLGLIRREAPKTTIELVVVRRGKRYGTRVTLGETAPPPAVPLSSTDKPTDHPTLGLTLRDLSASEATRRGLGARVLPIATRVSPGSAAERAGLRAGDVILEVDRLAPRSAADVESRAKSGKLLVRVTRGSATFYAALSHDAPGSPPTLPTAPTKE